MTNQFNNQLGYGIFCINAEATVNISNPSGYYGVALSYEDISEWQYNTRISRGSPLLDLNGIWKIDATMTVQGATNANMQVTMTDSSGALLPVLKWNQRGGNNWCINYSVIVDWQDTTFPLDFRFRNEDSTTNLTIKKLILVCTKLY